MGGWYLGYKDEVVHYNLAENQLKQGWTVCGRQPPKIKTLLQPCFFIEYDFCKRCLKKLSTLAGEKYKFEWVGENWERENWDGKYSFDWSEISKALREAADFKCENCGRLCIDYFDPRLLVHHIDRNKRNDEPENLIVLCQKCHARRHHGKEWRYDS